VARQRASDALCRQIGVEPFELPDHVEVPGGYSPLTHPAWPSWAAHAWRAFDESRPSAPPVAKGKSFCPIQWARDHAPRRF
jgi:hypothetical protein